MPYNHINSRIDAIFHKVEEFEIEHLRNLENGTTLKEMRTVIAEAIGRKNRHKQINTASLLINKFITSGVANKHWRENTVKKFGTMKHHLETFNENLKINDIDEKMITEYLHFLAKRGLTDETLKKEVKLLKWFLKWAQKNGYYNQSSTLDYKPAIKTTK